MFLFVPVLFFELVLGKRCQVVASPIVLTVVAALLIVCAMVSK